MIKKTKLIETQVLGGCKFRYPMIIKTELVSGEPVGSDDYWIASSPTLNRHASAMTKKESLVLLGQFILCDLATYRYSAPDGNTEDANELLRLLEALIVEEDTIPN